MVRRQHAQRSIFEMILPDGDQLWWDPELRRIDKVLEDEALIDQVQEALGRRWPQSRRRGRPGTPAAAVTAGKRKAKKLAPRLRQPQVPVARPRQVRIE